MTTRPSRHDHSGARRDDVGAETATARRRRSSHTGRIGPTEAASGNPVARGVGLVEGLQRAACRSQLPGREASADAAAARRATERARPHAAVVVASWALSPELLKLLPWSSRNYAGLPVVSAMYTVFAIKVAYKSALILLKSMMLMHLNAWQNMIIYTLLFNATLWVRNILQSALAAAALRAEKTKWTRISIFLSYRVNPDQVLVGQLCAPTVTEPTRTR